MDLNSFIIFFYFIKLFLLGYYIFFELICCPIFLLFEIISAFFSNICIKCYKSFFKHNFVCPKFWNLTFKQNLIVNISTPISIPSLPHTLLKSKVYTFHTGGNIFQLPFCYFFKLNYLLLIVSILRDFNFFWNLVTI